MLPMLKEGGELVGGTFQRGRRKAVVRVGAVPKALVRAGRVGVARAGRVGVARLRVWGLETDLAGALGALVVPGAVKVACLARLASVLTGLVRGRPARGVAGAGEVLRRRRG